MLQEFYEKNPKNTSESEEKPFPRGIAEVLQKVADRYNVEAAQIYKKYLQLRDELDSYPLESFKKVLLHAGGEFEKGYILPFKLNYDDKLTCLTVYKVTDDNSRNDIISEIKKAEMMLPLVSDKNMMSERDKIIASSFEQASKEKLLQYLWKLFDSIKRGDK